MDFFSDSPVLVIVSLVLGLIVSRYLSVIKFKVEVKDSRKPDMVDESAEALIRKFFTSEKTHFRNSFSNKFLTAQLKECQKRENDYVTIMTSSYAVHYLRYMTFTELTAVCIALRKSGVADQVKNSICSTITAASILFDFEIPPFLIKLDQFAYQSMAIYILSTRRKPITVLLDEYEKQRPTLFYKVYTDEQLFWLYHLTTQAISMAQFISTEKCPQPPSFQVILQKLIIEKDELWVLVNKNEDNLKLLMTFTFVLLGLEVPKDCYFMNDFLFCVLKNNKHYPNPVFEEVPDTIPSGQAY